MKVLVKCRLFRDAIFVVALAGSICSAKISLADDPGPRVQDELVADIHAYLTDLNASGDFNGSVLVTIDGEPVLARGYGLANLELGVAATPHTKYRIGSITKQFTSMAIMILQERGLLSVGATLGTYLQNVPEHWANVTLHQLLTHTSGIMHSWDLPDFEKTMMVPATLEETLLRFHDQPLLFEPGTSYNYSGVGYFLLAKVIEIITGRSYEDFLRSEIFTPLGMNDTGADRPEVVIKDRASGYILEGGVLKNSAVIFVPILTGGGNLYSTAEDLSKWDRALTEQRLISPESYVAMFRPELENYAYGWRVGERDGRRELRHGGGISGFRTHILRIPDESLCVIVLSNFEHSKPAQIADALADMVMNLR